MNLRTRLLSLAAAIGLSAVALPAAAVDYFFNATDVGAFGAPTYGKVSLTQVGTGVLFNVSLDPEFNFVTGTGFPLAEGTRERTSVGPSAAMMLPSSPQLPPKPAPALHSATAAPPSTAIFLSLPSAKNPIQSPAGEKNGE